MIWSAHAALVDPVYDRGKLETIPADFRQKEAFTFVWSQRKDRQPLIWPFVGIKPLLPDRRHVNEALHH